MRNSHLNRLVANGNIVGEFAEQFRCHPDIARVSSFVVEETHVLSHQPHRDNIRARFIRKWNKWCLSCESNAVVIDLQHTYGNVETGSQSQSNQAYASVTAELIRYLLEFRRQKIEEMDIAVIVPYEAQRAKVANILTVLHAQHPGLQVDGTAEQPVRDEASVEHAAGELSRDSDNANTDWPTEQPVREEASVENAPQDLSQQTIRDEHTVEDDPAVENVAPESSRIGKNLA
ncbi:uncharacterized protein N7473_003647 [Penicillium subrubescens]|uniref:DNA2/NAM7 helicase-like C-terminal domain-containing protein n=1 Tax=Penicillium subrubescens TaxID=1316194 RepID=A0A1Q5TL61_9EURO|nr:uncharacterized protein N7473_003647 [Penicillium subrubescens]KAJ5906731.1 hypothetical protein N7473_003647 [Penicillium subrubescens]OKP00962.1 hypothetical protein PENSUB_7543 [Penicillium subrubescens]